MIRLKRWIAATLAACLMMNTIPVYAFEETDESIPTVETTSEVPEVSAVEQSASEVIEPSPVEQSVPEVIEPFSTEQSTSEAAEPTPEVTQTTQTSQETQETRETESQESMELLLTLEEAIEEPVSASSGENEIQLAAEGAIPTVGDAFADSFINILNINNISTTITKGGDGVIILTIGEGQGEILALLSQQKQTQDSNYQNWNIKFDFTGTLTLPGDYKGLGDENFPFKGKFTNQAITIKTSKTLFKALDASADLFGVQIEWEIGANDDTPIIPILTNVLVADGNARTINMPLTSANRFNPYIGKLTGGVGEIALPALNYANVGTSPAVEYLENVGLVCGSMDGGTNLKVGAVTLPSVPINFKSTLNVGSLVGSMGEDSTLIIAEALTLNATLNGANVGGLVGSMTNATINVEAGKTVTVNAALTATGAAGGLAGVVTTATGPLGANANVVLQSVKANGAQNSGVLYGTCIATGVFQPLTGVSFGENAVREVSGPGNCGGLFGTLTLSREGKCTLSATEGQTLEITTSLADATNATAYGGIAGKLTGARAYALIVENCTITSNVDVGTETAKYPKYLGGIVAKQKTATVDAKNSTIKVYSPKTATSTDYGFGGVTAYLDDKALLILDGMKVVTDSYSANPGGGGVVGSAHKGSIVYLKSSLDLSECQLSTNATSGQIVGSQDCSLVYAPGVAITRLDDMVDGKQVKGMELDDIGNYGELYRINSEDSNDPSKKAFLSIGEDYGVIFNYQLTKGDTGYTLSSKEDYACLALAWQARGAFSTISGNWEELKSKDITITLGADIVLTGCGIGGLTRDVYSVDDAFTGTFNGGGKTLTMDIGAENSVNTVTYGDGRIYWHNATGLFAGLSSTATVNDLTLAGGIRLSNNKLATMYSGALAAQVNGSRTEGSMLSKVSTSVNYDAKVNGGNTLYLGGLIGLISGGAAKIDFNSGTSLASNITISHSGNGSTNHFGGAIGGIAGGASANITCSGASLAGKIDSKNKDGINNLYASGLIGTIWPATNSSTRNINLTSLKVNGFTITGNAKDRMSGILGGIWEDTDVTINGLTVSNATLTASDKAELGGLVYRASGKWTVNSVDLSGLTISANNAKALGLLVCHGEPYKEPVNATTLNTDVNGLYLEMAEHWDWNTDSMKGYNIPSGITFGSGVFDEFVAYTAYRNTDTNYDITRNGSGIISLKTEEETVNMEGEGNVRNTYENRTSVSTTTNKYSRYYYNLPTVLQRISTPTAEPESQAESTNRIDTSNELLIWSVYRYAASNLKKHFSFSGVADNNGNAVSNIGGTFSDDRAAFDMNGLSYYPINITNESVTVQYADVKFYNYAIEGKETTEPKNKSTRGSSTDHSQHYTMHCALFLNFTAENITKTENYTITVNGVTFSGTVGVVNGGSGALLCGNVKGESTSGNTATCTVVLADADASAKAVSLNGLSVASEGDYTPVLINKFGSYAGLTANYITTTDQQTTKAGSSLIGDVGGADATHVTVTFGGTIKLPETPNQVFTKATLLNSLQYADGSATYTFTSVKDNGTTHDTTHGKELTTSVEYEGKIGFYDDQETTPVASKTGASDFNEYLPYVAFSPAKKDEEHTLDKNWHELAVNIHSYNLTNGCGTYGHPYIVTAKEFREAASFVNSGKASNGWKVNMPVDNVEYHNADDNNHEVVTYTSSDTVTAKNIQEHLRSAYYKLVNDDNGKFELSNFNGIGSSPDTAFMGVIYSANITVTLTGGSSAFIKYSYGSVVRDVSFTLEQTPTLTWKDPGRTTSGTTPAQQSPETFFGGVIGCVLGGDNIIESVAVSGGNNISIDNSNQKNHLVPVGGYVGVIAGGGVIFRGTCSNTSTITGSNEEKVLYRNPIIGRVLGGYAFYEGTGTALYNGNKDYKINKITPVAEGVEKDLRWEETTLTVNTAQGLLVLSAIVSSGAGSTESNAYKNGVARNAKYDHIGETADNASSDFALSNSDTTGSVPYLLKQYAGFTKLGDICAKSDSTDGITIKFVSNATFDMDGYGNGYRGLSARYVSNAAFSGSTVTPSAVVLRVKTFDGQNAAVRGINMDVKEYNNDDFHMASMGGIFNIVWTQKQSGGDGAGSNFAQNLTLKDCNVSLVYVDSSGNPQNQADSNTLSDADGRYSVSVGGFIGMANDIEADGNSQKTVKHNYLFTNIRIECTDSTQKCQIYGPNGVGGLIGTTAMASTGVTGYPGKLLANGKWALFGPNFLNCSYSNIEVTGGMAAGGLIGDAYASGSTTVPGFSGLGISYGNKAFLCYASCTVTHENLTVGASSTIKARAKGSIAAGIFGAAGMRVGVNDPGVTGEDKSGLSFTGTFRPLKLSNVNVLVSQENYNGSNPDSGADNAYAGGIIARIGSENPVWFYDIDIQGGKVASSLATSSYVGGIVGSGYTNKTDTMERCSLSSIEIEGVYAGGFLGRGLGASGFELHMSDCKLTNSKVIGQVEKDSYAGGVVGNAASKYYLHNILLKNVSITAAKGAGRLFGYLNINEAGNDLYVQAAGISVYADSSKINVPESIYGGRNRAFDYTGYIAYADYAGTETTVTGAQAPYVTVNPNFTLTGADKTLYGDAVGQIAGDTEYNSVAARIWADHQTGATYKKNLVSYANASAIVNAAEKTAPEVSTFREVQGYTVEDWGEFADLPVLVLKGNDASAIEDYLNVITNGGYEKANVTPTVSVYYFDKEAKTFSAETDEQKKANPASIYYENGQFHIRSRTFDNTLNRFSLVETSFTVKVNGVDRTYTVSVPVVVIRELQFDYMATFSYGKEFSKDTYDHLTTHLLESTGNPFTAYLTYQYNREKGKYVEYDWQTYMDDGGSMLDVDKDLSFSSGLPAGTQMVLVDCQNGNQAYQYTTSGASTKDVKLSGFTSLADGTTKFQSSMADILGVTRSDRLASGKFVEATTLDGTVRLNGTYYRPYNSDTDSGKERYDLTVPDLSSKIPEENFYLVIMVPTQEGNPSYYINGSLSSTLDWTMPSSGTQLHRYNKTVDNRNNTESTYQISTGYRQELISTASVNTVDLGNADQKMQVKVQDTITFSNQQTYGDSDQLFLKFMVNLQEYTSAEGNTKSEEKQFPVGTTGTVKFYVQAGNQTTYYTWNGTQWVSQTNKTEAASYLWESNGGNMELLLSNDGKTALDLSGVRQMIKGTQSTGDSQIIVTAEMDIEFGSSEVFNAAVPGSENNGTDTWAQLHYLGQISTQKTSLSYSAMRATVEDNAKYYRGVSYQAVLSMDAMQIDQLGVNPLQLVQDYKTTIDGKNASRIDLTGALNLANLQDIESVLKNTENITFTLSLQRRQGDAYVDVANASDYIAFDTGWSWTIPKDQYYNNGAIVTNDIFDGTQFTFPITAYVFTDQKGYANYKIKLTVSFGVDSTISVTDSDAYVVYTYACIKPSFYEPQSG